MVQTHHPLPHAKQEDEHCQTLDRNHDLPVHASTTPRSRRDACVTASSKAGDSRVSAVLGQGRSIGTSWAMRPGCDARITTREERNTASATEWVTNSTVHFCSA